MFSSSFFLSFFSFSATHDPYDVFRSVFQDDELRAFFANSGLAGFGGLGGGGVPQNSFFAQDPFFGQQPNWAPMFQQQSAYSQPPPQPRQPYRDLHEPATDPFQSFFNDPFMAPMGGRASNFMKFGGPAPMFTSPAAQPVFASFSSASSSSGGDGGGYSRTTTMRTVNGVTETVTVERDAQGNERRTVQTGGGARSATIKGSSSARPSIGFF